MPSQYRREHPQGYWIIFEPKHPNSDRRGYVLEHRYVMACHLGRALTPQEVVHHKDENKKNNAIDNLELLPSKSAHVKLHKPKTFCHCGKPSAGRGLCVAHYKAKLRQEKRYWVECEECQKKVQPNYSPAKDGRALCWNCRFPNRICLICGEQARANGFCLKHYKKWWYYQQNNAAAKFEEFVKWVKVRDALMEKAILVGRKGAGRSSLFT